LQYHCIPLTDPIIMTYSIDKNICNCMLQRYTINIILRKLWRYIAQFVAGYYSEFCDALATYLNYRYRKYQSRTRRNIWHITPIGSSHRDEKIHRAKLTSKVEWNRKHRVLSSRSHLLSIVFMSMRAYMSC